MGGGSGAGASQRAQPVILSACYGVRARHRQPRGDGELRSGDELCGGERRQDVSARTHGRCGAGCGRACSGQRADARVCLPGVRAEGPAGAAGVVQSARAGLSAAKVARMLTAPGRASSADAGADTRPGYARAAR